MEGWKERNILSESSDAELGAELTYQGISAVAGQRQRQLHSCDTWRRAGVAAETQRQQIVTYISRSVLQGRKHVASATEKNVCWSRSATAAALPFAARMSRTLAYFFRCLRLLIGRRCYCRAALPPLTKSDRHC